MDELTQGYTESIKRSSLDELAGALGQIDREKFPKRFEFIQNEIAIRKSAGLGPYALSPKKNLKKRLLRISVGICLVVAVLYALVQNSKLSEAEIQILRKYLDTSSVLRSRVGDYEILQDDPKTGHISVSLLGKPTEGTLLFRARAGENEGYVSVDWIRDGGKLSVAGIRN